MYLRGCLFEDRYLVLLVLRLACYGDALGDSGKRPLAVVQPLCGAETLTLNSGPTDRSINQPTHPPPNQPIDQYIDCDSTILVKKMAV